MSKEQLKALKALQARSLLALLARSLLALLVPVQILTHVLLQSSGRKQSRDRGKVKAEVHRVQKQLGNVKVLPHQALSY